MVATVGAKLLWSPEGKDTDWSRRKRPIEEGKDFIAIFS
jgi:hypothetical protein